LSLFTVSICAPKGLYLINMSKSRGEVTGCFGSSSITFHYTATLPQSYTYEYYKDTKIETIFCLANSQSVVTQAKVIAFW